MKISLEESDDEFGLDAATQAALVEDGMCEVDMDCGSPALVAQAGAD